VCSSDLTWQKFQNDSEPADSTGALLSVIYQPLQRTRPRND